MLVPFPLAVQFDILLLNILLLFFTHLINLGASHFFSFLIQCTSLPIFTIHLRMAPEVMQQLHGYDFK